MSSTCRASAANPRGWVSKRITEMDVHLRHEQRGQQLGQLGRHLAQLHHDHGANSERHIVLAEKLLHLLRIAHHDPRDRGIGRFRDAERDDMGVMRMQQLHHVQHRAHLVRQKNRELFDERSVNFRGGLRQIDWHEKRGATRSWPGMTRAAVCHRPRFFCNRIVGQRRAATECVLMATYTVAWDRSR